jgi:hypothetical protein
MPPLVPVITYDNCVIFSRNEKTYKEWAFMEKVNPVINSGLTGNPFITSTHGLFLLLIIIEYFFNFLL